MFENLKRFGSAQGVLTYVDDNTIRVTLQGLKNPYEIKSNLIEENKRLNEELRKVKLKLKETKVKLKQAAKRELTQEEVKALNHSDGNI
jgi:hypothetical protein